jgi:hypothetical protein
MFGSFPRLTLIQDLCVVFKVPQECDFITKLFRQQVGQSYGVTTVKMFATSKDINPNTGNIRGLNLEEVNLTRVQVINCYFK